MDYYSEEIPPVDSVEVYETSDTEVSQFQDDNSNNRNDNNDENENKRNSIDESNLIVHDSREVFENEIISNINTDFNNYSGYKTHRVNETYEQKLLRIANELQEMKLISDRETKSDQKQVIEKLQDDATDLLSKLKNSSDIEIETMSQKFTNIKLDNISSPKLVNTINDSSSKLLELNKRLNDIENTVGLENNEIDPSSNKSQSLQIIINDIYRRINIISNPEFSLNEVTLQVNDLNSKLEIYSRNFNRYLQDNKNEPLVSITDKKIDLLYSKIKQLPNLKNLIELIINKLKSMNNLINNFELNVNFLDEIKENMNNLSIEINNWNEKLDNIDDNLNKNIKQFENNKIEIKNWIENLESKI
ncbi:unnamed protein product [[Candida] boidinii]|uniref:Unnamed protein product n=1 Tax=Candida boidinii TaxID=5477 RepID=A0A9W6SZA7_CANBO|nr:unnamed protein product [[Candida] boidinii]